MAGSFMYGVSREKPTRKDAKLMDRACKAAGGYGLVESIVPGIGYQRWFVGPNAGSPFDEALARHTYNYCCRLRVKGYADAPETD